MKRTRITRIPVELHNELVQIKKTENIKKNTDCFRRMVEYSQIGREFSNKDLLTATGLWYNVKMGRRKKWQRKT